MTKNFSCKIEELPSVAEWCNSLLKNNLDDFKDYSPDFNSQYVNSVGEKITIVSDLVSTKLYLGDVSVITRKLYDNMDAARPWLLKLEGYIKRAESTLITPAKNFDIKLVRANIRSRDAEGFSKNLTSLLQICDKNASILEAKGMKPELIAKLKDILLNNSKFAKEQNDSILLKEKAVNDNMKTLNDLWKDCQNIMDAGKRIYKYNKPEMIKNFTMTHIKKLINHTSAKNNTSNDNNTVAN